MLPLGGKERPRQKNNVSFAGLQGGFESFGGVYARQITMEQAQPVGRFEAMAKLGHIGFIVLVAIKNQGVKQNRVGLILILTLPSSFGHFHSYAVPRIEPDAKLVFEADENGDENE